MGKPVTFETVRRGWHLVDQYGQVCRVEAVSRKYREVETRRRAERDQIGRRLQKRHVYWDDTAKWTPEQFDAREFVRLPR